MQTPVHVGIVLVHHYPQVQHTHQREDTAEEDVGIKDEDRVGRLDQIIANGHEHKFTALHLRALCPLDLQRLQRVLPSVKDPGDNEEHTEDCLDHLKIKPSHSQPLLQVECSHFYYWPAGIQGCCRSA